MKIFLGATALLRCEQTLRVRAKKKFRQNITVFSISERKTLAYRYFFSMNDEESHSGSYKQLQKDWDTCCISGQFGHCCSQYTSTPLPSYQCCYGFSYDLQSNKQQHWKREGVQKCIKVFHLFSRVRFQLVIQFWRRMSQQICNCL